MSPSEVQRLEALSYTESTNILVPVTMANSALNFNCGWNTETSYTRTISGQIYHGTPFVPRYFLLHQANCSLQLQIANYNLQITVKIINYLPLKWSYIKLKTNWH